VLQTRLGAGRLSNRYLSMPNLLKRRRSGFALVESDER
jgi:hypothetical protein